MSERPSSEHPTSERHWTLAPIEAGMSVARACIVIDAHAADQARPFVVIDETEDALGLLGCIADLGLRPIRWFVVWLAKAPQSPLGGDDLDLPASNVEILRRWRAAWRPWDSTGTMTTAPAFPGNGANGPVLLLDRAGGSPEPVRIGRERLEATLCTDDDLLAANGLPRFSSTTSRFLIARPSSGDPRFVRLSGPMAPDGVASIDDAWGGFSGQILFNAGGPLLGAGPIRLTPFDPVGFSDHCALLHGEPLRSSLRASAAPRAERRDLEAASSELLASWLELAEVRTPSTDAGRLFGASDPRELRELEACFLRVSAVADMVRAVREAVLRSGQPLFNVGPESFSVEQPARRDGLPFLWSSRVRLSRPGIARIFTVESDPPLRLFARPSSTSLDSLVPVHDATAFVAEAMLLDVADAGARRSTLKVQLVPRQAVSVTETDLLRFMLRVGEHPVNVLARPLRRMVGRQPFEARSLPFAMPATGTIRPGASVTLTLESLPMQGTPHDLYALFVLACRMLLAGGHPIGAGSRAESEEAETLAHLRAALGVDDADQGSSLGGRERLLFATASDLHPLLYPAPLRAADGAPTRWPEGIPMPFWSDVLRALASMRPGWPGCGCRDLADFDPEIPHAVFDRPLAALEGLSRRLQTMLLGERRVDADIRLAALELLEESNRAR